MGYSELLHSSRLMLCVLQNYFPTYDNKWMECVRQVRSQTMTSNTQSDSRLAAPLNISSRICDLVPVSFSMRSVDKILRLSVSGLHLTDKIFLTAYLHKVILHGEKKGKLPNT